MRASGQLELALENYEEARDAFRKRSSGTPPTTPAEKQLDLSEQVLALDPNARGLRAAERYQRSNELLQAEVMRFDHCQPGSAVADPARKALANHPRRMRWRIPPT